MQARSLDFSWGSAYLVKNQFQIANVGIIAFFYSSKDTRVLGAPGVCCPRKNSEI